MQQDVYGDPMSSHIRQLLDEISWEGNARKYRDGGMGLENVVTTEVFQALDLLPRHHFLAPVLRGLQGGSPGQSSTMAEEAEALTVSTLPGDLTTNCGRVRVQPDALLASDKLYVLVEAKAPATRAAFAPHQLAKEIVTTRDNAAGRCAILLLVLGTPPPLLVRGHGRLSLNDAIELGAPALTAARVDPSPGNTSVRWTTWRHIAAQVQAAAQRFTNPDPSVLTAVTRAVHQLTDAVSVHSTSIAT